MNGSERSGGNRPGIANPPDRTAADLPPLDEIFERTGGIFLSQLSEMIDVPTATLQNWVKRGYVSNPVGKRYSKRQTARMLFLALMRQSLSMDEIVLMLGSINNNLADENDDLIDDSELYRYFREVALAMPESGCFAERDLLRRIRRQTAAFQTAHREDRERLERVLSIMVQAYAVWRLRRALQDGIAQIREENER